ncbi:MAG: hypothetical protein J6Q48_03320 [Bacteroidaceae bacterium]|nr:hypothetical protein [Bacteroidaceae bacterium]
MNKNTMVQAIVAKVDELESSIKAMKDNLELSENTVRTQTYQRTHEIHNLLIIKTLLEGKDLEGDVMKWFESTTTLTSVRKARTTVEFHDGDNMLEIISAHQNITYKKLIGMMEEQGFHLDGHIVKSN